MTEQRPEPGSADARPDGDETIVAVRPALSSDGLARPRRRNRGWRGLLLGLASLGLVGLALAVFFVLPRVVERAGTAPAAAPSAPPRAAPDTAQPAAPELSPEELARLEAEAEQLLADLLSQQERLEDRAAESWGGAEHERYEQLARNGDDAYLADDFAAAIAEYEAALEVGRGLLARSALIVDSAFAAAGTAFDAGNAALALEQLDLVLSIEPGHAEAERLHARASRLPDVLELVERGEALRQAGDYEAARAAYEDALAIDARWPAAQQALAAVEQTLRERRFESLLSNGYAALAREDWEDAIEHFEDALAMRPDSSQAREGIVEAEAGAQLDAIALAEARALAFERRELWQRAIEQYEAALATDPRLEFAQQGLARARARADLDAKLERLIDEPTLLFDDGVLADSRRLLEQAHSLAEPESRLASQAAELERLVDLATTPVTVELRSDQMTEVTVYRVGQLGTFAATQIEVRPGRYTIVGSRRGYRDVRETITVLPNADLDPVTIACEEPI